MEAYGFDLVEALKKYPIRELQEPNLRDVLFRSLEKGNLQSVALDREGSVTKVFIEANPKFKDITLYDSQLKRFPKESLGVY